MTNEKLAKLHADFEKAENRMTRAITKWMKLRAKVKRLDAKADKELMGELPGKADVVKLAQSAGIKPRPWPKERPIPQSPKLSAGANKVLAELTVAARRKRNR